MISADVEIVVTFGNVIFIAIVGENLIHLMMNFGNIHHVGSQIFFLGYVFSQNKQM